MSTEALKDLSAYGLSDKELFAHVDNSQLESEKITAPRYSYWKSVFRVFFKKKSSIIFIALLALIVIFSYVYPAIIGYDPNVTPYIHNNQIGVSNLTSKQAMVKFGQSLSWILGSGSIGESTFDQMWYGSSVSFSLAFTCGIINMTVGVIIGAIWGFSKVFDKIMIEVYNVLGNIPYILLISVLVLVFKASFWTMVFALTITGWLGIAYFIRTQVIIIRDREYNLASRCLGTNIFKLTTKNILPYMTSVIVTLLATEIPSYISYEVFLSYIGIGMKDKSLGKLIEASQKTINIAERSIQFWAPVAIASIITIVLYVVGQNLGDASDPRTHM